MKSIKVKSIFLLAILITYIFLIPDKFSITSILVSLFDLPTLLAIISIPILLMILNKGSKILVENISIIIGIIYSICWAFFLTIDKIYLIILPIIYGLTISILIPTIKNLTKYKLSFSVK